MALLRDEIRSRILREIYRQSRDPAKPVDFIALAARIGVAWPDAATHVIALRRAGLVLQPGLEWSVVLTPEGRRHCEAELGESGSVTPDGHPETIVS